MDVARAIVISLRVVAQTPHIGPLSTQVRRARLKVVRGADRGRTHELGEQGSAVIGCDPEVDFVLTDRSVSMRHAELICEAGGYTLRDLGSTNGIRVGDLQIREAVIRSSAQRFSLGETEIQYQCSDEVVERSVSELERFGVLRGRSRCMRELFARLERVAPTHATVLVQGESGTGKEGVAESIHSASPRAHAPFVVVDCGAIPRDLFEVELFGCEKGAFTGADRDRRGLAEEAHGGTLFLDEVAELPLELQPRLLRLLENREVRRVGACRYTSIDVRVIAASHRPLAAMVSEGRFRHDLYHRLAVLKIDVPPVRHRRDDIELLAKHFAAELHPQFPAEQLLTPSLIAALSAYAWPGNVRELRNAVERLLMVGELLTGVRPAGADAPSDYAAGRQSAIDRFEHDYCRGLLEAGSSSVVNAARKAGISRQMFYRLMQKHNLHVR